MLNFIEEEGFLMDNQRPSKVKTLAAVYDISRGIQNGAIKNA